MEIKEVIKEAFSVIGKEGSSNLTGNWIKELWNEANSGFEKLVNLAVRDEFQNIIGIWGAMSNMEHTYEPWENNYTRGLYLAGVEVYKDSIPPVGFTKWEIPSFKYLSVKVANNYSEIFSYMINEFLPLHNLKLMGAVQEYYNPIENMQLYLYFPIEIL